MTVLELPSRLIEGAGENWKLRRDVADWVAENLGRDPVLTVKRDSQWVGSTRKVLLSSIDITLAFESVDEAFFFRMVWL